MHHSFFVHASSKVENMEENNLTYSYFPKQKLRLYLLIQGVVVRGIPKALYTSEEGQNG